MSREIFVIGLQAGFALSGEAVERLAQSDVILASPRLNEAFAMAAGESKAGVAGIWPFKSKVKIIQKVEDTISFLRGFEGRASVLASGDPLFFGIGGVLLSEFPREEVKIYPAVSSVQLAFAKAGKSWEDAFFVSLHGPKKRRWRPEDLPLLAGRYKKLAILTGGGNGPKELARFLPEGSKVFVLERLGSEDESMIETTPSGIKDIERFWEPNLLIVETGDGANENENEKMRLGLEEKEFLHSNGLITKDEVRAVILHKLRLPPEGVMWDVGAGSGSVGIEAKRLSEGLDVYMVEKEHERVQEIVRNGIRFNAGGINAVLGEAPSILAGLPAPDRVFIGGSGGRLSDIIRFTFEAMKDNGIIVVSAITLESINEAVSSLEKEGFQKIDAASVSISRMAPVGGEKAGRKNYLQALNPVFIIRGRR